MNSKKVILAFCMVGILLSSSLYAQDSLKLIQKYKTKKSEISISISRDSKNVNYGNPNDSLRDLQMRSITPYDSLKKPNYIAFYSGEMFPTYGLGYSYHFEHSAIRSKIVFYNFVKNYSLMPLANIKSYNVIGIDGSIGFELNKRFRKWETFGGSDIFFAQSNATTKYSPNSNSTKIYEKTKETKWGLRPFVGISYFFIPNISLSTEIYYDLAQTQTTIKEAALLLGNTIETTKKNSGRNLELLANLALDIHF
jgi:hypothetical protein